MPTTPIYIDTHVLYVVFGVVSSKRVCLCILYASYCKQIINSDTGKSVSVCVDMMMIVCCNINGHL